MISINLNEITILSINGADYRCIIKGMIKSDAVGGLQNADLTEE